MFTQLYTLEQTKRGLCPYDDKRYLLADFADGEPNPITHAYGHKDYAIKEQLVADMPDGPGTELFNKSRKERLKRKAAHVVARVEMYGL